MQDGTGGARGFLACFDALSFFTADDAMIFARYE